jgi:hypothetical protein
MTDDHTPLVPPSTAGMTREEAERVAYQFRVDAYNARCGMGMGPAPAAAIVPFPSNVVRLDAFRRTRHTGER